jgi:hypothetical protein
MTEEQIQALADRRLLRPKSQVGWRPVAGEEFPTEGTGETVVFLAHIERGFGVSAGDFLRGLLHFSRIELVHLALLMVNSCIKVCLDLQADKSLVIVKGPFFPRVVNPRYRIRGTNV